MRTAKSVAQSFDILVQNHTKLKGSKEEFLDIACETVLESFSNDASSILGPICEQITRTTKKSRRTPYLNIAQWLHEKSPLAFDRYIQKSFELFLEKPDQKRRAMGSSILIRSLGLSSNAKSLLPLFSQIVSAFTSDQPSFFEMEIFNSALYLCSACGVTDSHLQKLVERYSIWMLISHPIASASSTELLKLLKSDPYDQTILSYIPLLRTDIPPSTDKCHESWNQIASSPFNKPRSWIEFGLSIGRFSDELIRSEISSLSSDKSQFSSIITVCLSAQDQTIQNISRALFKFGIHGQETAAFDPSSLSQILETSDDLSGIAITFLSEMALANASSCVPQLFPLLHSDKPVARKNSLELLSRILNGPIDQPIRQMIASNLLPLVGDEAITVRVDIPKLFVSVPPSFIVPSLIQLLGDKDERKRATASASLNEIMKNTSEPEQLLKTILDAAIVGVSTPQSPAAIQAGPSKEAEKSAERVMKLVEDWANKANGTMLLDPTPVLERFWADPKNGIIVSFMSKSATLYDSRRLLSALISKLQKKETDLFDRLAPLLILRSQPLSFFTQRETVASPLFDLLFIPGEEEQQVRRVRGEILARFPPNFVIPKLLEYGLFTKFSLFIICIAGQIHGNLNEVCDKFEENILTIDKELFIPVCDAFFFANQDRFIDFGIKQNGSHLGLMMLNSAFRKFQDSDCVRFINRGCLQKVLQLPFNDDDQRLAVEILFIFAYKCRDMALDQYWEPLFDIASHFSDSKKSSVRFESLKLLGALASHECAKMHLIANAERFQHIIEMMADDSESEDIRKLAAAFLGDDKKPKITELENVQLG
ncbi:hypothetical protein GPJ56_008736 [Histomonas meleagridis]|uniref:uncharacterized protein n=1 Tax=Histomonas meleagridis TaxID=135588 RepID=UPI0035599F63|nr:hypothetical protein GPJ56_008736 [Histomonas meleagridis]KAH0805471.1 hypothetical protein GO595_001853 [Histomonas meleagridis]